MTTSNKLQLLGNEQIQRILQQLDYNELAILMAYHLDDAARRIVSANMTARAWERLEAEIQKATRASLHLESIINRELVAKESGRSSGVILFTDLVNSTAYQSALGDIEYYEQVIIVHNAVMEEVLHKHLGRIIKTIGDSYLCTFAEASRALLACNELLETFARINQAKSPQLQIFVRCALHEGQFSFKLLTNGAVDVFGSDVNYAARIVAAAEGGKIFFSKAFSDVLDRDEKRLRNLALTNGDSGDYPSSQQQDLCERFLEVYAKGKVRSLGFYHFKGFTEDQELFTLETPSTR